MLNLNQLPSSIQDEIDRIKPGQAFINGQYIYPENGNTFSKISPVTGHRLPEIAACQKSDVDAAVQASRQAFLSRIWCDSCPAEKKRILYNLADLIEENLEELAILDTVETGRSIKNYVQDSIPKAIEAIRWFAEAVDKFFNHATGMYSDSFATIIREPLGVVGLITPWNDPLVVAAWKLAPALLMGNSVILKPAEQSTYSILRVAQLAKDAGIPDGVFNVIPGEGKVAGQALACHPDVDGIFFTGSSRVGKEILIYSGQSNMKKIGLECGGKSPFIISDTCSQIREAVQVLCKNIFYNQGQICSAPSRLLVLPKVRERVLKLLTIEAEKYIPKDPFDMGTDVGCVVSEAQRKRIECFIKEGRKCGAKEIRIGADSIMLPSANCILPTIFIDVNPRSAFARQEIFGPVLSVIDVGSLSEAITVANDSCYGLAAAIWTDSLDEAYQASRLLRAGIVHVNSYGEDDNTVPFGGIKESGFGKDKSLYAFNEYTVTKTVWMKFKGLA
jgi:acyl-CoA reductase-like NAD-dependent aldehyde dehydrogenase